MTRVITKSAPSTIAATRVVSGPGFCEIGAPSATSNHENPYSGAAFRSFKSAIGRDDFRFGSRFPASRCSLLRHDPLPWHCALTLVPRYLRSTHEQCNGRRSEPNDVSTKAQCSLPL